MPVVASAPTSQTSSGRFAHIPMKICCGGGVALSTHQAPVMDPAQCVSGSPHAEAPAVPVAPPTAPVPAAPPVPARVPAAPPLPALVPAAPPAAGLVPAAPAAPDAPAAGWLLVVGPGPPVRPGGFVPPSGAAEFELLHPKADANKTRPRAVPFNMSPPPSR